MAKTMAKTMLVFVCGGLLAGCNTQENKEIGTNIYVWSDPETGCQYLHRYTVRAGITPRLGQDGKPMCGKK